MKKVVLSACFLLFTVSIGFGQGISPELAIDEPKDGLLTRDATINVSGSVFPPARSTVIKVNGQEVDLQTRGGFHTTMELIEGTNTITITAQNKPGNTDKVIRQVTLDTTPPEITISSPSHSSFTNQQQIQINGSLSEPVSTLTFNGEIVPVNSDSSFSTVIDISEGQNNIEILAADLVGNSTSQYFMIIGDFNPPETSVAIALGDPSDSETEIIEANHNDTLTIKRSSVYLTGEVYDALSEEVVVAINAVSVPTTINDSVSTFEKQVDLDEGISSFEILATDQAGNATAKQIFMEKLTTYPHLAVNSYYETPNSSFNITGTVSDTTENVSLRMDGEPVSLSQDGAFSREVSLIPGDNFFLLKAINANGDEDRQSVRVVWNYNTTIPPEPEEVASVLDSTVVTTMQQATEFLYSGENPIQRNIEEGAVEPRRASVVRGKVLDNSGKPLSGVLITVLDHPEYGYTITRSDGMFDLAVNGGGTLILQYEKDSYLPVQRRVNVPWQDYATVDSVMMVQLDPNVTTIDFSDSTEVAQGSMESDADGSRQATLMFEQGTNATMVMPDGSTQPLRSLNVRATEYTVGENGPESMPAKLPPASGYTYAVEFSVDEALEAGAAEVTFDKPVVNYVENFVGFPVGTPVPTGYYDRQKGQWIPSENGKVIEIKGITDGLADIDISGDGMADPADSLLALGIDQSEREELASLYSPGESLWRVEVTHFTPWDHNWPFGPPADAEPPAVEQPEQELSQNDKSEKECGSVISVENRTLGEALDITGAPCGLYYNNALTKDFKGDNLLPVTLTGDSIPASLTKVKLEIEVAGTSFDTSFTPQPGLVYDYRWNEKDAYGRLVQGAQTAEINIGYVYDGVYNQPADDTSISFAQPGQEPVITGDRETGEITLWQKRLTTLGNIIRTDFGSWQPGIHHQYDITGRKLFKGNGTIRPADNLRNIVREVVPEAQLEELAGSINYLTNIDVSADGSLYISLRSGDFFYIVRQKPEKDLEIVLKAPRQCGDDNSVCVPDINGISVTDDETVYFISGDRIQKINRDCEPEVIAGTGNSGYSGDGGLAINAQFDGPVDIAVAGDGSIYIADQLFGDVIRKIGTDGIITTIAGTGEIFGRFKGDEPRPALQANLDINGIDIGPDGSLYIASRNSRIRKITPDGIISTVAGSGKTSYRYGNIPDDRGDNGPATSAILVDSRDVVVGEDGSIYIADQNAHHIRKVTPEGIIYRFAGLSGEDPWFFPDGTSNRGGFNFNNGPAQATRLSFPAELAIGPDDNIYFNRDAGTQVDNVRMIESNFDYFDDNKSIIASKDGGRLFIFDSQGKHLRTLDALTGNTIFEFEYDTSGFLSKIIDIDGQKTIVERAPDGTPTAFVAPFGQRTELTMGPDGYLSSIQNPEGETTTFSYTEGGLLTEMNDPKNNLTSYQYDSLGYFVRADYPNGGFKELSKVETEDGFEVTMTTSEGSTKKYEVDESVNGSQTFTNTDANGLETVRQYGSDGIVTVTSPDGTTTYTQQKPDPRFGMQGPLTDTLKVTTPSGLESVFSQNRTVTQMTGDEVTGLTDSLITNGKITVSEYDGNNRLRTTTSPEGRQTFSHTDSLGRVIQSSTPGLEPVNYTYNADGFVTKTEQGGRTTEFTYNSDGWLESTTNPLGRTETTEYDSIGRVTKQLLSNGEEINYEYDENGNLASITPPGQPAHTFDYTEVDLTESYTPPAVPDSAGGINYLYDLDKKLLSTVFSDSTSIDIVYDSTFSGTNRPVEINYDQGSTSFAYDTTTGQLSSVASSDSVITSYRYDGSLTTQIATSGPVNGTIDYTYNNDFEVTSQSINGSNTVGFSYDDDGLLVGAGALSISYDQQNGLLTSDALGTVSSSYSYNAFGELSGKTATYNGSDLYDRTFSRDSLGRITGITETIDGETDSYEYSYNDIGYLVQVKKNGSVIAKYVYDANGNRTSYSTPTDTVTATYDEQDRMLTYGDASYDYGPRGDLQRKIVGTDTTRYNYDNQGNLRSVTLPDGKQIEYLIDGQDRRVAKKVNGQITKRWLYADGLVPVAELDSTGTVQKRYGPGYIVKNDTTYRVVKDHLGSVRMVVNSQTGEVVQRIDYDAWGNITHLQNEDEFTDIGFAGGLYDQDTDLIRFGARDYDPKVGRWTSKDPILFDGGASNLYEYALNDPVNRIDPDGLQALAIRDFAAGLSSTLSLGLSEILLDRLGSAGRRDECSAAYRAGGWTGAIADVALGGKGLLKALGKNSSKTTKYLYHYTSKEAAESISKSGLRVGKDGFSYLTDKSTLKPLQAQIELALPANRALPNSVVRVEASGLSPASVRRVQGNLRGLGAGGGTEYLFNKTIPANLIDIVK